MKCKKLALLGTSILLAGALGGCGGAPTSSNQGSTATEQKQEQKQPLSLDGTWQATNSADPATSTMEAEIKDGTITIYLVSVKEDTKMLYWQGTVPAPDTTDNKYNFTSEADTEALSKSIMGSQDKTKDFKYENGVLSFDFTAMGTTKTIKMERK